MPYFMTQYTSPLGALTLVSDGQGLAGLWIEGQKYFAATLPETPMPREDASGFEEVRHWLDRYFAGGNPSVEGLPLHPAGSVFRQAVWACLRQIPYGEVTTYGRIARQAAVLLGRARLSAQAVGGAVGHNPIAILIPCHRVVGADGLLTGYAGGLDKKEWLLRHEGVDPGREELLRKLAREER